MVYRMSPGSIDPKMTEEFLMTQDDVQDASVWLEHGQLHAHVTPAPGSSIDPQLLCTACAAQIGAKQTPGEIMMIAPRVRTA